MARSGFFARASPTSASTSDAAPDAAISAPLTMPAAEAVSAARALAEASHHRTRTKPAATRDPLRNLFFSSLATIGSPRRKASRSRPFGRREKRSTRDQTRRAAKRRKRGAERARGATWRAGPESDAVRGGSGRSRVVMAGAASVREAFDWSEGAASPGTARGAQPPGGARGGPP